MIKKILVANRGEIAIRVMRSCKEMGIHTVAVYSEADRTSRHVFYADEACCIGGAVAKDSYLDIEKILAVAKKFGADAIHPGYGFLSENAQFSRRCKEEGIIFIGAPEFAMRKMGDKISARQMMIDAGVPVVPGTQEGLDSVEDAVRIAKSIGLPVMFKASAGGGGKGIRLVYEEKDIENAYLTSKSEAISSFGDGTIYVEKYIESPHHIEFQILGDQFGNVVHLCERECSVQRRHQKVLEESPSPLMTPELRAEMGERAVAAAKAGKYEGAGTIEFLVDDNLNYYFLEMNTRLQVEHPITEEVVGIDLVKEQINVANGLPLRFKQEDIKQRGHAIECRICAEDADNGFIPAPGIIKQLTEPLGIGVRVDSFVYDGYEIPMYYDSMIGKLIVWAVNRKYAIERMRRVLYEYKITGVKTNISYLRKIIDVPDFQKGRYDTNFLEANKELLSGEKQIKLEHDPESENIAIIAAYIDYIVNLEENSPKAGVVGDNRPISKWREFGKRSGMIRI
ncbi:MAG: acetyl-CoA carboxylase biotin carboxylase subunit [Paludibacteraceae bacterium]|nr:acetyl-CoA carboxylase biotin carboxylase subunit [Paludibacteraceae bacterium]